MFDNKPLTAVELIEKLKQLPPDTKIIVPSYDMEYMGTHYNHVYDISPRGHILDGLCAEDWYEEDVFDYIEDEDIEELNSPTTDRYYLPERFRDISNGE